jgi:hypothetical protein
LQGYSGWVRFGKTEFADARNVIGFVLPKSPCGAQCSHPVRSAKIDAWVRAALIIAGTQAMLGKTYNR